MIRLGGFRGRLVVTLVALVALTALVLGSGAYLFMSRSLRARLVQTAVEDAAFNLTELAVAGLSGSPTLEELEASDLEDAFRRRGGAETFVDLGGEHFASRFAFRDTLGVVSPRLVELVTSGRLAHQWVRLDDVPYLVVGGRRPPDGPDFYFFFPATDIEAALLRLREALVAGGLLLVATAALAGRAVASRILRPVRLAGRAAQDMAQGDFSTRLPVESDDEFGAWAASFNRMAASLEEKVGQLQEAQARQRRFVADVSHELRTPLTALVNEAVMLRDHLLRLDPQRRRLAEMLVNDVRRLRMLVEDLMEISRFDAASEELELRSFDLRPLLEGVVATRMSGADLRAPAEPLTVLSDRRRLERILGNLLDNARQHAEGSPVEVAVDRFADQVTVTVSDRGPGVVPENLERLFERFFKSDPSRSRGGSGLGLAIAQENARLLGGRLTARLRPQGGMAFDLQLPVTHSLHSRHPAVTSTRHTEG
ncbi:MAG: HAMP domain-containing histidine kinase [Actinomycetota bacterium]|nr:HAMP domain-containing histidine kinase [Actinomycetota bacterium]